jgi:hypothetical protein
LGVEVPPIACRDATAAGAALIWIDLGPSPGDDMAWVAAMPAASSAVWAISEASTPVTDVECVGSDLVGMGMARIVVWWVGGWGFAVGTQAGGVFGQHSLEILLACIYQIFEVDDAFISVMLWSRLAHCTPLRPDMAVSCSGLCGVMLRSAVTTK